MSCVGQSRYAILACKCDSQAAVAQVRSRGTVEVLDAVGPLNAFLIDLHGPTDDIARTMSRLVPFPAEVGSFFDAELLDLNVSVQTGVAESEGAAVEAWARYATGARVSQVRDFYIAELTRVGATVDVPALASQLGGHVVSATLDDAAQTRYRVMVEESLGYRAVKVIVSYGNYDHRGLFGRFADWHNGSAPVTSGMAPTGVEISTFANGRRHGTLVLYSTDYACPQTSVHAGRAMVDTRIGELGWTYREPREGMMFIQDGHFDAETHVLGDDHSSSVTFVGEFQLR
jgi:hypothetical protein